MGSSTKRVRSSNGDRPPQSRRKQREPLLSGDIQERVRQLLGSKKPQERREGVGEVRRLIEIGDPIDAFTSKSLLVVLSDEDSEVRDSAKIAVLECAQNRGLIGLLANLVISLERGTNPANLKNAAIAVEAIGETVDIVYTYMGITNGYRIGGLLTLNITHNDPEVREAVRNAIKELTKHEKNRDTIFCGLTEIFFLGRGNGYLYNHDPLERQPFDGEAYAKLHGERFVAAAELIGEIGEQMDLRGILRTLTHLDISHFVTHLSYERRAVREAVADALKRAATNPVNKAQIIRQLGLAATAYYVIPGASSLLTEITTES